MTRLAHQDFTHNLVKLLEETFEEGGNVFLDRGAGLFQTLDTITPEVALRAPLPGAPSIAAHCAHLGYYVRVLHNFIVGREQEVDWPSSWRVHSLGVGEWEVLKGSLRSGYDELRTSLNSLPAGETIRSATAWRLSRTPHTTSAQFGRYDGCLMPNPINDLRRTAGSRTSGCSGRGAAEVVSPGV